MIHHTKNKGDTGVGFVIADLMSKGIQVCIPISEHLPFDLIGVKPDGTMQRISVKYRTATEGKITLPFKSTYSDSKGTHTKSVDKNLIDIMAIYCPDTGKVYYIKPNDFGIWITLRIEKPKNNQTKGILLADDYLLVP